MANYKRVMKDLQSPLPEELIAEAEVIFQDVNTLEKFKYRGTMQVVAEDEEKKCIILIEKIEDVNDRRLVFDGRR